MFSPSMLHKAVIIGFLVLVGFSLAKAIYHESLMGIALGMLSLGAAVYFLYLLGNAPEEKTGH